MTQHKPHNVGGHVRLRQCTKVAVRLLVLTCCLSGCTSGISVTYTPPAANETIYDYFQKISALSAEERMLEKNRVELAQAQSTGAINAVKLALLLSLSDPSPAADEARAIELLTSLPKITQGETVDYDYQTFAKQRLDLLLYRQKFRETAMQQAQTAEALNQLQSIYQQLDERYIGLARVMAKLEEQNSLLARQNSLMQHQIEALTIIEQQLAEREQTRGQQ